MNNRGIVKRLLVLATVVCGIECALTAAKAGDSRVPIKHRFLVMDESRAQMCYVDETDPSKGWEVSFPQRYRDFQLIGNYKVLVSTGNGFREYDLRSREMTGEIHDAGFAGTETVRRTADARTFIGCNQKGVTFFELDGSGNILRTANFPQLNTLRVARLTARGTILFGANTNKICEVDMAGKVLREILVEGSKHIYEVEEKPDGRLLASLGYGASLVEIDGRGKVVRTLGGKQPPQGADTNNFFAGFQVLKNGNAVVCNWTGHGANDSVKAPQLLEYSPDEKLVWQWHDPARAGSLHGVIVLDELDDRVVNGEVSRVVGGNEKQPPGTVRTWPVSHRFLKAGCGSDSVAIVGRDGAIEWDYKCPDEINDAWLLPGGNVIFAFKNGVREVRADKSTVWEYKAPEGAEMHSCQPMVGGKFLVGEAHKEGMSFLFEMDRSRTIAKAISIPADGGAHSQFRQVRKTPQGTYLVTYQRKGGTAKEFDGDGKLLRTFAGGRFVAIRLPDGNTLIGCGDEHRVIEVDRQDRIVWEIGENDVPGNILGFAAGLQRLPNGNTVICNWSGHGGIKGQPQVFEVTRDKKVVWEVNDKRLNMISSIAILDPEAAVTNGEMLR